MYRKQGKGSTQSYPGIDIKSVRSISYDVVVLREMVFDHQIPPS
jgi:hypothetical protein